MSTENRISPDDETPEHIEAVPAPVEIPTTEPPSLEIPATAPVVGKDGEIIASQEDRDGLGTVNPDDAPQAVEPEVEETPEVAEAFEEAPEEDLEPAEPEAPAALPAADAAADPVVSAPTDLPAQALAATPDVETPDAEVLDGEELGEPGDVGSGPEAPYETTPDAGPDAPDEAPVTGSVAEPAAESITGSVAGTVAPQPVAPTSSPAEEPPMPLPAAIPVRAAEPPLEDVEDTAMRRRALFTAFSDAESSIGSSTDSTAGPDTGPGAEPADEPSAAPAGGTLTEPADRPTSQPDADAQEGVGTAPAGASADGGPSTGRTIPAAGSDRPASFPPAAASASRGSATDRPSAVIGAAGSSAPTRLADAARMGAAGTAERQDRSNPRTAAHWGGVLVSIVTLPVAWFFLHDGAAAAIASAAPSPYSFTASPVALARLAVGAASLILALWAARQTSLGSIVVGTISILLGLPFLVAPAAMTDSVTPFLVDLSTQSSLGASLSTYVWTDAVSGKFVALGLFMIMVGVVSHSARRAGRRDAAVQSSSTARGSA